MDSVSPRGVGRLPKRVLAESTLQLYTAAKNALGLP